MHNRKYFKLFGVTLVCLNGVNEVYKYYIIVLSLDTEL